MPLGWGDVCTSLYNIIKVNISIVYGGITDICVNIVVIVFSSFILVYGAHLAFQIYSYSANLFFSAKDEGFR